MKNMLIAMGVAVMMLSFLPFSAVGADTAELPQWNVGDKWAIGYEHTYDSGDVDMQNLTEIMDELYNISDLSVNGNSYRGVWSTFEVTGDDGEEYTLHYNAALKAKEDFTVSFTALTPVEGTYTFSSINNASTEEHPMEIGLHYSFYVLAEGDIMVEKSNMAVKNITMDLGEKLDIGLTGKNTPSVEGYGIFGYFMMYDRYSMLAEPFELTYEDTNIHLTQSFQMNIWSEYTPGILLADFPLYEGKQWNQTVISRFGGTYDGTIDVTGLPKMVQNSAELYAGQEFPIDMRKLDLGDSFDNGIIRTNSSTDDISLSCEGTRYVKGEDGNMKVFLIGEAKENYSEEYSRGYADGYSEGYSDGQNGDYDSGDYYDGAYWDGYHSGYSDGYYDAEYYGYMSSYDDAPYYYYEEPSMPFYLMYSPDREFFAGIYVDKQAFGTNDMMPMNDGMKQVASALNVAPDSPEIPEDISFMDFDRASESISSTEAEMNGETSSIPTMMVLGLLVLIAAVAIGSALVLIRHRKKAYVPPPVESSMYPPAPQQPEMVYDATQTQNTVPQQSAPEPEDVNNSGENTF
jgi:hypothetical protein